MSSREEMGPVSPGFYSPSATGIPSVASHLENSSTPIPKIILPLPGRSRNLPIQKCSPAAKSLNQQVTGCWRSQPRRPLLQYTWTLGSVFSRECPLSALREGNKPSLCRPGPGQRRYRLSARGSSHPVSSSSTRLSQCSDPARPHDGW